MERISWFEPEFGEEEIELVSQTLKTGYVNEGPKTLKFTKKLEEILNVKHVVATTSGTIGLYLALKASGIKVGDEVIIPDITMIGTANAVKLAGGIPILVDVNQRDYTISVESIKNKITSNTKAIISVNVWGRASDLKNILELAKEKNLKVIEDSAGCLGSKFGDKYLGTIGDVGVISLAPNKIISTGQGGIILTNSDEIFEKLIRLKDHGRLKRSDTVHSEEGYNFKFNDIQAAIGLGQLSKLNERLKNQITIRKQYEEFLVGLDAIKFLPIDYNNGEIPLCIEIQLDRRDELIEYLRKERIDAWPLWMPIHKNPIYDNGETFPNSDKHAKITLWLPSGPKITAEKVKFISEKICDFYK